MLDYFLIFLAVMIVCLSIRLYYYMYHQEPYRIDCPHYEIFDAAIPECLDGLRICQISDIHCTDRRLNQDKISEALSKIQADLYVFTGDMIYEKQGVNAFFRWLDQLEKPLTPASAILGNAEHKPWIDTEQIIEGLSKRSISVIMNDVFSFQFRDGILQMVGVDDPHTDHADFAKAYGSVDESKWTLLLCHSPDGLIDLKIHRADLMLCGHTHGGQVRLPFIGALISNTNKTHGFSSGWFMKSEIEQRLHASTGAKRMYVCRGLGTGSVTARFLCSPELPVFILRKSDIPSNDAPGRSAFPGND
jgi:predicted MPP superfamily phosphohydrolase